VETEISFSISVKIELRKDFGTRQRQTMEQGIFHQDCVEGMKTLANESADIIIVDPPYNIGKDFGNESDKQQHDDYLSWCGQWLDECLRTLKPDGTLYIYGFSEILAYLRVLIGERCHVRWLVWHYTNKTIPRYGFWQRSHESILVCSKNKIPHFNLDDVREEYTESFIKNAAGKERAPTKGRFNTKEKTTVYKAHAQGALPRDVIKVPALAGGAGKKERVDHPTQKPLALCEKLLNASRKKDAETWLLVPFVGSGSECVMAKQLGISFLGYEINKEYIKLAQQRLDAIS